MVIWRKDIIWFQQCRLSIIRTMQGIYRIAGNFCGQADLHEIFPHENMGVVYRNACNHCDWQALAVTTAASACGLISIPTERTRMDNEHAELRPNLAAAKLCSFRNIDELFSKKILTKFGKHLVYVILCVIHKCWKSLHTFSPLPPPPFDKRYAPD